MAKDSLTESVCIARNLTEADLIAGLLGANGIDTFIEDEEGVVMLDGIVSGNLGVTVSVRREDVAAARDMIEDARALGRLTIDDDDENDDDDDVEQ